MRDEYDYSRRSTPGKSQSRRDFGEILRIVYFKLNKNFTYHLVKIKYMIHGGTNTWLISISKLV